MQRTLMTTSSPPSVTVTEVAETDTSFLEVQNIYLQSGPSFGNCSKSPDWYCWGFASFSEPQWHYFLSRGGVFFLFEPLPLLFFAIRLGRLIEAGRSGNQAIGQLCFLELRLLSAGFFGGGSLGLHLWGSVVGRAVAPRTTGIRFPNHDAGF